MFQFGVASVRKRKRGGSLVTFTCGCLGTHLTYAGELRAGGAEDGRNPWSTSGEGMFEAHVRLGSHALAEVEAAQESVALVEERVEEMQERLRKAQRRLRDAIQTAANEA